MQAAILSSTGIRYEADFATPEPSEGMVRVRVRLAGICETDLQLMAGYMGFNGIPGHEFVGTAESGEFAGRRVVGEINCGCRRCDLCRSGNARHCPNRTVIGILNHNGAFADYLLVPRENLHPVPDNISDEAAVFTEPVAAACRINEQLKISPSDKVVVLGDGRLGSLISQVLRTTGCRLTVVGKHEWKLQRLRELGISAVPLQEAGESEAADIVVDCTGAADGFRTALSLLRPCGTLVLKTTVADSGSPPLASVVIDEITVLGSRCGPFEPALSLLADGAVQVESLITQEYRLKDVEAAIEHARRSDALKILLRP